MKTIAALCSTEKEPVRYHQPQHSNRQEYSERGASKHDTPTSGATWEKTGEGGAQKWVEKSELRAEEPECML